LNDGLEVSGIRVVSVQCTEKDPVPQVIRAHTGDHFNSTLYLLDGFNAETSVDVLRQLATLKEQLIRPATWVVLCVESLESLVALYEHAPALMVAVMHRCLVIGDEAIATTTIHPPATALKAWHRHHRLLEHVYATISTLDQDAGYRAYTRVLHAGYGHALPTRLTGSIGQMHSLWLNQQGPRPISSLASSVLEAVMRHDPLASTFSNLDDVVIALDGQFLPYNGENLDAANSVVHRLRRVGEGQFNDADVVWLQERVAGFECSQHARIELALCVAQGYAAQDDVEACRMALANAERLGRMPGVPLEYLGAGLAYQCRFFTLTGERTEARRCLNGLEHVAQTVGFPLNHADLKAVTGMFNAPIDARKARSEFLEAERLYRAHGYLPRAQRITVELGGH